MRLPGILCLFWLSWLPWRTAAQDDATYKTLVQRAEGGDLGVDFRLLRLSCLKAPDCEPRGSKADLGAMTAAASARDFAKVAEICGRLVHQGFVNIEAHAMCVQAYSEMHDRVKSKFHLDVVAGLMRSVLDSGDGKTRETAYQVICDREEYMILTSLGLPYDGPAIATSTIMDAGHRYQKWEGKDKAGYPLVVFFNLDAFVPGKSE